jgi:hypothetical protein
MTEPEHRKLDGLAEYADAIDEIIGLAKGYIHIFDYSLDNMGFNSVARYDALHAFLIASTQNRLSIVVKDSDYLGKHCPRMLMLLRRFGHNMAINRTRTEAADACDPFCVVDGEHFVRRFHFDDPRGIFAMNDPHECRTLEMRFEQIWEASETAICVDLAGL